MANDALAQSGIDLGLSGEADYDAVYAAVTATERGRWFLTELADRTRRAETAALMAAIARVETAVRGDAPPKQAERSTGIESATERLAGIAIALRERGADRTLCDALDAAVREISLACGDDAKDQKTGNGGGVVDENRTAADPAVPGPARQISSQASGRTSGQASDHAAEHAIDADSTASEGLDMALQDSAKFAAAAAALAASLTALSEDAEAAREPQGTSSAGAIPPHDYATVFAPRPAAPAERQAPRWHIDAPDFVFHQPQPANDRGSEASSRSARPQTLLPGPQLLPSPDEDPAELFEPAPKRGAALSNATPMTPAAKPPNPLAAAVSAAAQAVSVASNPPPSRGPTGPTVRPMPRPAPVNPLAALRGLTEEELIALFG
jgi:hypothetical protein